MNWNEIIDKVTPYIVRIETPEGHGTGFLFMYNADRSFCGIATAYHVVEHAERWQQPLRIIHYPSNSSAFLPEPDRIIWGDADRDSAVILVPPQKLKLPEQVIPLLPSSSPLPIGVEVGWLGYPAIGPHTLCFFCGNISARQDVRHAYLIDGVTINGISGGPVIYSTPTDGVRIVGAVTAYIVNRATGESLPGLSVAQDVSHFHDITARIKSFDEAKAHQPPVVSPNPPPPDAPPPDLSSSSEPTQG
ncbi:MAG: serine protease [Acidobacteriia bacterium]|nr:serine protease [Terriglobia bacterium]